MKRGKLIAWAIWLVLGLLIAAGLIGLLQRMLISGVGFIDELGELMVKDGSEMIAETAEPTVDPDTLFDEADFDGEPVETPEPEELFSIPVEQTAEELAKENE